MLGPGKAYVAPLKRPARVSSAAIPATHASTNERQQYVEFPQIQKRNTSMKAIILATAHEQVGCPNPLALMQACGVSLLERHVRTLKACGVVDLDVVVRDEDVAATVRRSRLNRRGMTIEVRTVSELRSDAIKADANTVLIVFADCLVEESLIRKVLRAEGECVLVDTQPTVDAQQKRQSGGGPVFTGVAVVRGSRVPALIWTDPATTSPLESLADVQHIDVNALPTFDGAMRRDRRRMWMRVGGAGDLAVAEARLIEGAQKGSLDWPAQVLHAPVENWVVARLCQTSVTPNQLTLVTNIVAWGVTAMILAGHMVSALLLAAVVGILDGIDGKLARVKLMTSRIGKLEHVFDMMFEYSWWFALAWVLSQGDTAAPVFIAGLVLIACNFADTVFSGVFWFFKGREHGRRLDNFTPFDLAVRKVSGRRNIYVWIILLTALVSGVEQGLWAAVIWGLITILVRGGRTIVHLRDRREQADFEFVVR